jgi:iron-sulfur cluster assembly protein
MLAVGPAVTTGPRPRCRFDMVRGSLEGRWLPKDPHQTGATLLTLTKHAQTAVRTLTQDPQAPESAGLRITPGNDGLELMLVAEPVPGDALIDDGGARVFVEPQVAQLLDEQTLDAQVEDGNVNFFLASPDAMSSPDALDDETQARHDASRAEPLHE